MTDLRTAAQQALEAIDWLRLHLRRDHQCLHMDPAKSGIPAWINKSETNLRAALAEPENWELRRLSEELERCKQVCAATSEAWREEAALAEPTPLEDVVTHGSAWSKDGKRIDPMSVYAEPVQAPHMYPLQSDRMRVDPVTGDVSIGTPSAEPVQEPVQCEPQYANEDGWCEWVCPNPTGYLMQCCDCGLIHEVESRVAKYELRPSEMFEVVDDPDLQAQWRMKRRDDISPKRKPLTEDEIALIVADCSASAHRQDDFHFARAIERAHGITS